VELTTLVAAVDGFLAAMEGERWPEGLAMPRIAFDPAATDTAGSGDLRPAR
jgi:hypothetical protein